MDWLTLEIPPTRDDEDLSDGDQALIRLTTCLSLLQAEIDAYLATGRSSCR